MAQAQTVDPRDTLAVLTAAREWLADPEHWTRGAFWRDASGAATHSPGNVAKTCAIGAMDLVTGRRPSDRMLFAAIEAVEAEAPSLSVVNDEYDDGYATILAGYDKAIARLEAARPSLEAEAAG